MQRANFSAPEETGQINPRGTSVLRISQPVFCRITLADCFLRRYCGGDLFAAWQTQIGGTGLCLLTWLLSESLPPSALILSVMTSDRHHFILHYPIDTAPSEGPLCSRLLPETPAPAVPPPDVYRSVTPSKDLAPDDARGPGRLHNP